MWWFLVFLAGVLAGVFSAVSFGALGVYFLIQRLTSKGRRHNPSDDSSPKYLDPQQSLDFAFNKKGFVWVIDSEKVSKLLLVDKLAKDQKKKKDVFEVNPVKKFASIKDRLLVLMDSDGSTVTIPLKSCTVEAVSASELSSRKWVKRFPIRVESKSSVIYNGSKTVYFYLETSWEKESWCKALRIVSCQDKERITWFTKLNEDFHSYVTSLNAGYPSFLKPSVGLLAETTDKLTKPDGSGSKVRLFLKKFTKKASRNTIENRGPFSLPREERKIHDKKPPLISEDDNLSIFSTSTFSRTPSLGLLSDVESDDKFHTDEGTLCWNLLISRMFFDAKSNPNTKISVQSRIKRALSSMRKPNYIGEIICTDIGLGTIPPHIHAIRVLPTDMNDVWAWELDVEYRGGFVLDVETRLEVQNFQKDMVDTNSGLSSIGEVSPDLLEDFENLGKELNLSEGTGDLQDQRNEGNAKSDGLKNTTTSSTSTNVSKWKSIVNSITKQVAQVPLSLSIKVASLRGTLRLHIKPPPSDQLWYGFVSMPDIDFDLESSVGDHKISSGRIALFLINRFKAVIRETIVLPNCESLSLPWMLAEKNDWVPRTVAPYIWLNRETTSESAPSSESSHTSQTDEVKPKESSLVRTTSNSPEIKHSKTEHSERAQQPVPESSDALQSPSSSPKALVQRRKSLQELTTPLLESKEVGQQSRELASSSMILAEKQSNGSEEDDLRPKRTGRRARMLDLGKKMGEKLEEKRRHIEEKSRNIVEKMRAP
ncbi:Nucleus-vacuole junction protein 2 [Euphorbia peplus]|nr:Nucleus-vacuole junction protein 2 [Euphorbia peplus]